MAVTLIETPGAVDANSFVSLEYADTRINARIGASVWSALADDDRKRALITATSVLNTIPDWDGSLRYPGVQALRLPRIGLTDRDSEVFLSETEIPVAVKEATCELAFLLASDDRLDPFPPQGLKSIEVSTIKLVFDVMDEKDVIPYNVWNMISHLLLSFPKTKGSMVQVALDRV